MSESKVDITDMVARADYLGLVKSCLEQLRYAEKNGFKKPYLKEDIEAYLEIIDSKSQENADRFLAIRYHAHEVGNPFRDGMRAIERMRSQGYWIWKN